jgi:O-antigen ligase
MFRFAQMELNHRFRTLGDEAGSMFLRSGEIRMNLYSLSLGMLADSYGLGVGVGNFENTVDPQRLKGVGGINVPHNFFFETIATEGLVGLILVIMIIYYPFLSILMRKGVKLRKMNEVDKRVLLFSVLFFISVAIPSGIRGMFFYWSLLGYNYALIMEKYEYNT